MDFYINLIYDASTGFESRIAALEAAVDMSHLPNERYKPVNIGTWFTTSTVDTFFALHNHDNGYSGLALGNIITINDGTYDIDWEIAGFDCEHNQLAADGTTYDNGYGICLIPKTKIGGNKSWNSSLTGAYRLSNIHDHINTTVANNLKTVLGNHLINRNVLLSNSVDSNLHSDTYTWTTSYCTLMSAGQLTGTFAANWNKYDDGEANYKLPLFNYENYWLRDYYYWLRGIYGRSGNVLAWSCKERIISTGSITSESGVRPLIYLR